ncbi:TrfA protein [Azotobacter beijerinckii]|uniref:TrfA protein n=1 Tax=Azotobacter beijerinckii TaxID=170623 RepID=A0A1H9K1Y7_9GAMM|nr:plasmid replication initiator TrfA [Azotobacter beijerinckii]SEQ92987.1 TrfA protein [Azotobacter beijerinckii]
MEHFDEAAYRDSLIARGMEPGLATDVAANVAANRPRLLNKSVTKLLDTPEAMANEPATAIKAPSKTSSAPSAPAPKSTRKPKRAPQGEVSQKESQAKRDAVLQKTMEEVKKEQLSLFDIAPWDDDMRAIPNDIARTALFTVKNKRKPREALQGQPIYSYNQDVRITFSGIELRAEDDELVWQQMLEYSKRFPIGLPISFTFYELCTDLGWPINGKYYKKAEDSLTRLQASALQFQSSRLGTLVSLSLLRRFGILDRGKRSSRCQVELEEEMVYLFAGDHYTIFVWEKYRKLTPTARRLFDYFASHKQPFPLALDKFQQMCGSDTARAAKWKEQSKAACSELTNSGLVAGSWVNGDMIYCKR